MGGCSRSAFGLFTHSHISCAGCVLQPLPVPHPSTPPKLGIEEESPCSCNFCSLIETFSPIPCSKDEFCLLPGTLAAVSAQLFEMCRWWGLCAVLLRSSQQEVTLSTGWSARDFIFLAHGTQIQLDSKFPHKHRSAATLALSLEAALCSKGNIPVWKQLWKLSGTPREIRLLPAQSPSGSDCTEQNWSCIMWEVQSKAKFARREGWHGLMEKGDLRRASGAGSPSPPHSIPDSCICSGAPLGERQTNTHVWPQSEPGFPAKSASEHWLQDRCFLFVCLKSVYFHICPACVCSLWVFSAP